MLHPVHMFSIHRLFHLVITLGFQVLIMRDMEKLTGSIRMTIIYVGAGIAGNLASCIFVPYHVEVKKFLFKTSGILNFIPLSLQVMVLKILKHPKTH